jgi:uncharacterized protein (UPF0261 family)
MSDLATRVEDLEHWRDGNGKRGAAAVIIDLERQMEREAKRNDCQDTTLTAHATEHAVAKATEKQFIMDAVAEAMKKRNQSLEGIIRAWGPYFAGLCALIVGLAPFIFKK